MRMKAFTCLVILLLALGLAVPVVQAAEKPNILVIMSDDVGITNISAYSRGLWAIKRPISIASPIKVCCLPSTTPNRAVLRGVRPLSPDSIPCAPV